MENLQVFLLILQVVVAVLMIGLVLLQKSDGDSLSGIGGGSGGLNSVMSSKSSANFLTKLTMFLVAIFMLNCLVLALISSKINNSNRLEIDKLIEQQKTSPSNLDVKSDLSNKTN
jgi:preprotein translocase subunit SecG